MKKVTTGSYHANMLDSFHPCLVRLAHGRSLIGGTPARMEGAAQPGAEAT